MGELPTPKRLVETASPSSSVDLQTFVENIRLFRHLSSPFFALLQCLHGLSRWNHPRLTGCLILFLNVMWLFGNFTPLAATCHLFVIVLLGVGLADVRTTALRLLPDVTPMKPAPSKSEIYGEFRDSILLMNAVLVIANNLLFHLYDAIRWRTVRAGFQLYGALVVAITATQYCSALDLAMLTLNVVLLKNAPSPSAFGFPDTSEGKKTADEGEAINRDKESAESETPEGIPVDDVDANASEKPAEADNPTVDAAGDSPIATASAAAPTRLSGVQDWWRGRKAANADQICQGCDVAFGHILKKRHYCRHCGDHYCSSCCNNYVPRYYFGATAPAARTEKVVVCRRCFDYLVEKFESTDVPETASPPDSAPTTTSAAVTTVTTSTTTTVSEKLTADPSFGDVELVRLDLINLATESEAPITNSTTVKNSKVVIVKASTKPLEDPGSEDEIFVDASLNTSPGDNVLC